MKALPVRQAIRPKGHDYSSVGLYFITFCVKDRHEMLGHIAVGDAEGGVPYESVDSRLCAGFEAENEQSLRI